MTPTAPILEIAGLTIALPRGSDRAHAVRGASLTVAPGEIVCLVGESGSGKSVIAHATMGLLPKGLRATGGQALLAGEEGNVYYQVNVQAERIERLDANSTVVSNSAGAVVAGGSLEGLSSVTSGASASSHSGVARCV